MSFVFKESPRVRRSVLKSRWLAPGSRRLASTGFGPVLQECPYEGRRISKEPSTGRPSVSLPTERLDGVSARCKPAVSFRPATSLVSLCAREYTATRSLRPTLTFCVYRWQHALSTAGRYRNHPSPTENRSLFPLRRVARSRLPTTRIPTGQRFGLSPLGGASERAPFPCVARWKAEEMPRNG